MRQLLRRLRYLLNRERFDRELASDMEFHREMAASEEGVRLGNTLQLREEAREAWGWTWIDRFFQDLRYGARMLRKSPGFTVAAILMLAIGIGVNVAAFGFFNLMFLRPLPVREPDTLLRFHRRALQRYAFTLPYPEMAFFREHSRTLAAVVALNSTKLTTEGEKSRINAHFVTGSFFGDLGAAPMLGRTFDQSGSADPAVVLSHGFWKRHFGEDALVIGKTIRLNGKPATVLGVASSTFTGISLDQPDLWALIEQQPYFAAGSHLLTDFSAESAGVQMWGRLQPGLSPRVAEEELTSLAARLRTQQPGDIWEKERIVSEPGGYAKSLMIGNRRGTGSEGQDELLPIAALVGSLGLLILAVSCGNLGSLLLARGVAREREIAIRVSVGAGSGRLMRQLFTESMLLALLGSAAGLAAGYFVLRSLMLLTAAPEWLNPMPDWRVLVFSIGLAFAAAILFGLAPALQVARQRHRATRMRQFLIGAQVAASCILLIIAGLLVRALDHVMFADPGFDYRQVVSIDPGLASHGYSAAMAQAYLDTLQSRLGALPGVESVSLTLSPPLGNRREGAGVELEGRRLDIQINRIDPKFFQTMKIPLLRGRNLRTGDTHSVVISQSLALKWPTGDPLGKKFSMGSDYTVIGIAGSARGGALENSDAVEIYVLTEVSDTPSIVMLARTLAPPESLARSAASISQTIDPGIFPDIQLMKELFQRKLRAVERGALAVSLLSSVAQLLACLGIVGLISYAVSQRTKEIGLRMALGAKPFDVVSVVLRQFSSPVAIGLVVGVGAAAALSQLLRGVLYGLSNLDPIAYLTAIGVFIVTVALAALLPARRALRVDPMLALRHE